MFSSTHGLWAASVCTFLSSGDFVMGTIPLALLQHNNRFLLDWGPWLKVMPFQENKVGSSRGLWSP